MPEMLVLSQSYFVSIVGPWIVYPTKLQISLTIHYQAQPTLKCPLMPVT